MTGFDLADLAVLQEALEHLASSPAALKRAVLALPSGARARLVAGGSAGVLVVVEVLPPADIQTASADVVDEDEVELPRPALPPRHAGDVISSPLTQDEWKTLAHSRKNGSFALVLRAARELAAEHRLDPPRSLDDIDEVLTPLVREWIEAAWPEPA